MLANMLFINIKQKYYILHHYYHNYHRLSIPSIFIVYMMLDTMGLGKSSTIPCNKERRNEIFDIIVGLIVMVGYMDHNKLFCSSRNLIESLGEVTPFCVINGK